MGKDPKEDWLQQCTNTCTEASEGNIVWYGQPSEIQFTREGGVAEQKSLEI